VSDTRGIVERLRAWRDRYGVDIAGAETPNMCEEAAAEITRLRRCLTKVAHAYVTGEPLSPNLDAAAKAFVKEVKCE
jgi:hypothetical protein